MVSILVLTGCGKAGEDIPHTETAQASCDIPEIQAVADDGGEQEEDGEEQNTDTIEIARKAMEEDIGEKAKRMRLRPWEERLGWKTDLCVADWDEMCRRMGMAVIPLSWFIMSISIYIK